MAAKVLPSDAQVTSPFSALLTDKVQWSNRQTSKQLISKTIFIDDVPISIPSTVKVHFPMSY